MMPSQLSPKMKMADAINQHHSLLTVLPRLGIPLGFGERSVEQLCDEHRVSLPLFLLIARVYTEDTYYPSIDELRQCPMADILQYLLLSHRDYLDHKLPHIEHHLHALLEPMDSKYRTLIANFYTQFKSDLEEHFRYEEEVIFPYLRQTLHDGDVANPQRCTFNLQHDDIEDTLNDLTNLLLKYIPSDVSSDERIDMLLDTYALSHDIGKHAMMEDRILLPYIQFLESQSHD